MGAKGSRAKAQSRKALPRFLRFSLRLRAFAREKFFPEYPRLFFRCLILLACTFAVTPAQDQDEIARSLPTIQSRRQALSDLIAERTRLESAGDQVDLVKVINRIGEIQLKLYDLDAALAAANDARKLAKQFRGTDNEKLLVDALTLTGRVHLRRDENDLALSPLNEALDLSRKLRYRPGEAESLTQLGFTYFGLAKAEKAEQSFAQALAIWRELQNKRAEARTLALQSEAYIVNDQVEKATAVLKQAEEMWREVNEPAALANTLNLLSFIAMRQGQWQNALVYLNEAQTLLTDKEAEPYLAGQIATSFGLIYEVYGQLETAFGYLREAVAHFRDGAHDKAGTIDTATKLARVQASLRDYTGATEQIRQALALADQIGKPLYSGLCHEELGRVWLEAGVYEQAAAEFRLASDYFEKARSKRPWARAQSYLAQTEFLLGHISPAESSYQKALQFFKTKEDYTNEAAVCFGLGKLALHQGQLDQAEKHLTRSLQLTELLRENASSEDLRSSFLDSVHDRYETYVEYLMARDQKQPGQGFDIRAFEANETGRARALLDSLNGFQRELRRPSDPALLIDEEKLQQEEQRLIDEKATLMSQDAGDDAMAQVEKQLTEVRSTYETLQARINSSEKFKDLLRPEPLTYESIKNQITDANTSLLSYSLGGKNSFAWLVTRDGLVTRKLEGKQKIDDAAGRLLKLLKTPLTSAGEEGELQTAIDEVSRLVLEPISDKLTTSRLIIVADGVLQYVPFQVLKVSADATEPLLSKFDIIDAPSASALAVVKQERMNRQHGPKLLVGFGDAVFSANYSQQASNDRSKQGFKSRMLPLLFHAKRELQAIGDLVGDESAFYVEHAASRDNLLKVDLSQFRILHVVTHGVLDDAQPEMSGLFLSLVDANNQPLNGFVGLADIYKMHAPLDLVVLSACHTALGKELRGEGLIGLTRGFMYAGASSVVASLWKVDDAATAELMKHFYTYMLRDGMAPPAALRAAQNQIRSQPKWRSPFYWAGFKFQGDYDLNLKTTSPVFRSNYVKLVGIGVVSVLLAAVAFWYLRRRPATQH